MFIIKRGDVRRLDKYKAFECRGCGCVFVAKQTEYYNESSQRDGTTRYSCVCPTCAAWAYTYSEACIDIEAYEKGVLKEVK